MRSTEEMMRLDWRVAAPEWKLRPITEDDAEALLAYSREIAGEPVNNTGMRHGLLPKTVEEQRAYIRRFLQSPNSLWLVAEVDGQLAGMVVLAHEDTLLLRHQVELSINIAAGYRGMGLGKVLITEALNWARANPLIRRVYLYVMTRNEGAIRLYRRLGFSTEGLLRGAFYLYDEPEPSYTDALIMAHHVG